MPSEPKLAIRDIYELLPDSDTRAGDIWEGLPTLGLLHQQSAKGIVITPACDLSNRKSETATYLPIVPVATWLLSRANRAEQLRAIRGQLHAAAIANERWLDTSLSWELDPSDCQSLLTQIDEALLDAPDGKRADAMNRARSGARILLKQFLPTAADVSIEDMASLLGQKAITDTLRAIVRNAYRSDVHFLPEDGQAEALSSMPQSCLALFRYPLTLPIEIFQIASDVTRPDWLTEVERLAPQFPAAMLATKKPLKVSRLRPRFFADLVARFVALHVRMGTPDFTADTVDSLAASIRMKT